MRIFMEKILKQIRGIDLFDFTSFFSLDFSKFSVFKILFSDF